MLQDTIEMYMISRTRNLMTDLEHARNVFRNELPALYDKIRITLHKHENTLTPNQFKDLLKTVDELNAEKMKFKKNWTTFLDALNIYGESILEKLEKRKQILELMHSKFGDKD